MSLLRYAASGILRNRRRTFSSILGVLLAVTFVAGTFIAIDSSARATLEASLRGIGGDFSYSANAPGATPPPSAAQENGTALRDALAAIPGVTDVSVYRQVSSFRGGLFLYDPGRVGNLSTSFSTLVAVDPYHLPYTLRDASFSGSSSLPNGTVILDSTAAASVDARLGDSLVIMSQEWNGSGVKNYTLPVTVGAIATLPAPSSSYGPGYPPPLYFGSLVAFNLRDMNWVAGRLNLSSAAFSTIQGEIWIDRNRYVNPYDMSGTNFQLTRLGRQLSQALVGSGYSGQVYDNIEPALAYFSMLVVIQRVQYLLLSFPVVLLGLYLGAVGVDLGHAERRRELGVLKTRGASRRQVAMLLVMESLLGGFVATILGLLFGLGLSRVLIGAVTPYGSTADYATLTLTPDTIITVAILSTIFMGIASYRSAKRTASLPIIETLRYYAPGETRLHYSPVADIAMIGYCVLVFAMVWYVRSSPPGFFAFMIAILFVITLPVTPILLILGSVRLLTRSTGRVYEWTTRLIRPFAKNLEYLVSRNLSRNPRRSSNIAIIIALGLAFGVFIVSALGSSQATQEASVRASIGADLSATGPYTFNATADAAFGTNLSKVAGIAQVSHVLPVNTQVSPSGASMMAFVVALDPSTYFSVSQPASFYFENPTNSAGAQAILATKGQVLITSKFASDAALQLGDAISLTTTVYPNGTAETVSTTVHVGGIVRFLPGTYQGSFYRSVGVPDEVYGSYGTFGSLIAALDQAGGGYVSIGRYLASLQPGADWHAVKTSVLALGASSVQVYPEQVAQTGNDPLYGSFLGFIRMEIAFIVVILTAGLALIIYAASLERTVEFAGITARGSSGWQTAGLLVGEAFSIMLIGVLAGLGVGLLTGYLSTAITAPNFGGAEPIVPNLFVFPLDGLLLVVLAPIAMMGTTLLVAWRIARMNVARVLKMRGG